MKWKEKSWIRFLKAEIKVKRDMYSAIHILEIVGLCSKDVISKPYHACNKDEMDWICNRELFTIYIYGFLKRVSDYLPDKSFGKSWDFPLLEKSSDGNHMIHITLLKQDMVALLMTDLPSANSTTDTDTQHISHGQLNFGCIDNMWRFFTKANQPICNLPHEKDLRFRRRLFLQEKGVKMEFFSQSYMYRFYLCKLLVYISDSIFFLLKIMCWEKLRDWIYLDS